MSVFLPDKWHINFSDIVIKDIISQKSKIGGHDVFRADYLGAEVCVKKLENEDNSESKAIERQIEILKLNHPNLVQFMGVAEHESASYIVMEYVSRGDLHSALLSYEEIDWHRKVKVAYDVAASMAYLHSKKIMHRNITSKNILVAENWVVKLCDFGFSRKVPSSAKHHLSLCGTDSYMAPEIIFGMEYNQKADVFSYGILLCEIITRVDINKELPRKPLDQFELDVEKFKILVPHNAPSSFVNLAIRCSAYNPVERPSFIDILAELKNIGQNLSERQKKAVTIQTTVFELGLSPRPTRSPILIGNISLTQSLPTSLSDNNNNKNSTDLHKVKSEHELHFNPKHGGLKGLKGSRSMDSLELRVKHEIVGPEISDERKERGKRMGVSVGKKLAKEVLDRYL